MASWYMVLFGITHLRLDIFITWWMRIFQSTVFLRHFISLFVHRYILGYTPFSKSTRPFSKLSFIFDLVVDPCELHTGAYPPSLGLLDLSQTIIFWPSYRSLWVVILGHIPSCRVCLHHYLSYPLDLSHLIRSPSCQISWSFRTVPILIGHSSC